MEQPVPGLFVVAFPFLTLDGELPAPGLAHLELMSSVVVHCHGHQNAADLPATQHGDVTAWLALLQMN
jgi:hypothetical protein